MTSQDAARIVAGDHQKLLRAVRALLLLAADRFAKDGCTDFNLAEVVPDRDLRRAIMRRFEERNERRGNPSEFNPGDDYETVDNWVLMLALADEFDPFGKVKTTFVMPIVTYSPGES